MGFRIRRTTQDEQEQWSRFDKMTTEDLETALETGLQEMISLHRQMSNRATAKQWILAQLLSHSQTTTMAIHALQRRVEK